MFHFHTAFTGKQIDILNEYHQHEASTSLLSIPHMCTVYVHPILFDYIFSSLWIHVIYSGLRHLSVNKTITRSFKNYVPNTLWLARIWCFACLLNCSSIRSQLRAKYIFIEILPRTDLTVIFMQRSYCLEFKGLYLLFFMTEPNANSFFKWCIFQLCMYVVLRQSKYIVQCNMPRNHWG